MDATNLAVLAELQEYAQLYFDAIKEHNTTDGVCELRPGNYSAKELADREKAACGAYRRPVGDIFDEEVSISVDTFRMRFPYREIFYILARWEAMCRPGKSLKSVFTVGDVEEKTAKVLLCEQTELGKYKAKGMKLQHLTGNWWAPRKLPKCDSVELVYELNGVMFLPGTQAWSDDISNRNSAVMEHCAKLDDAKTTEALLNFIATQESAPKFGYFVEVARRAGVNTANTPKSEQPATPTETPQISTEAAETVNVSVEGEKAAERTNVGQNYSDTRVVKDEYHHRYKVTRYWLNGRIEAIEVWDLDHTSEPPQSLEAPPTAKHPTPPPILGRRRRKRARRGAQAAPGLRSAPGMCAGGCGASRPAGRREAPVTSLRGSVGISGMVYGGSFHRGALPRAGPPSLLSAGEGVKVA